MYYYIRTQYLVEYYLGVPEFIDTWNRLLAEAAPFVQSAYQIANEMRMLHDSLKTTTEEEDKAKRKQIVILSHNLGADLYDIDNIVYRLSKAYIAYSRQLDRVIKSGYMTLDRQERTALNAMQATGILKIALSAHIYFSARIGTLNHVKEFLNWNLKTNIAGEYREAFINDAHLKDFVNDLMAISLLNNNLTFESNEITRKIRNLYRRSL